MPKQVVEQGGSFTALSFGRSDRGEGYDDLFAVASTGIMYRISREQGVPAVEPVDVGDRAGSDVIAVSALPGNHCGTVALFSAANSYVTLWGSRQDGDEEVPVQPVGHGSTEAVL